MTEVMTAMSPRVTETLNIAKRFTPKERIVLAKLLLDSVVLDDIADQMDWQALSLTAFEKDWDNPEDAIYDN